MVWLKGPKRNWTHFKLRKSKYYNITDMDIHFADNASKKLW